MVFSLCLENCFRWLLSWNHSLFSQIHPLLIQAIRHNQSTKIAYYAAIPKVLRGYSFGMIIRILSIFWHFFGKMFQKLVIGSWPFFVKLLVNIYWFFLIDFFFCFWKTFCFCLPFFLKITPEFSIRFSTFWVILEFFAYMPIFFIIHPYSNLQVQKVKFRFTKKSSC